MTPVDNTFQQHALLNAEMKFSFKQTHSGIISYADEFINLHKIGKIKSQQ